MANCGCGTQLDAVPTLLVNEGPGTRVDGYFQNPGITISARAGGAWRPFIPSTFSFSLGDAELWCRYLLDGKTVDIVYNILFGSTSSWTANEFELAIPSGLTAPLYSTSDLYALHQFVGDWSAFDRTAGLWYEGRAFLGTPSGTSHHIRMRTGDDLGAAGTADSVRQGTPFTFATGDELSVNVRIELS